MNHSAPWGALLFLLAAPIGLRAAVLGTPENPGWDDLLPPMDYRVDLSKPGDDLFHVTLDPGPLSREDRFFEFVAFAPGVHSVLNLGRFVRELHALDAQGTELPAEKVGMNRWELGQPERVARIAYILDDSFGAEGVGDPVAPYAGTGIEEDYVLLNPFGVCGYFPNHLERRVRLWLEYPPGWVVGTALQKHADGSYHAESYRRLADSPFLMGELSHESILVGEIEIEIFVHAKDEGLNATEVMYVAGDMLQAAAEFIGFAPVERYVILVDFMDARHMLRNGFRSAGALEHSYCSFYSLPAGGNALDDLAAIVAHEFMHILTPLHLRSTIIAEFDFSMPTTDQQLWLYEGLTEWTAGMLRLRGGLLELEEYLMEVQAQIRNNKRFSEDYSLERLSREWSTEDGLRQYGNIYQLGALTAMMLDIRLLQLSGGQRGLREVFVELIERFGVQRPFDDASFHDVFVEATYPEIRDFFASYVSGREPLPFVEYFELLGIEYVQKGAPGASHFRVQDDCSPEQAALRKIWMTNRDA